jgi:hypothetical protein
MDSSLGQIYGSYEDQSLLANSEATGTHPIQGDNSGELLLGSHPEYTHTGHITKDEISIALERRALEYDALVRNLQPGLGNHRLQAALGRRNGYWPAR